MTLKKVFDKNVTSWSMSWNIALLPVAFMAWWYSEYLPFLWQELQRLMEIFANSLSLKLVIKNFFKPWKNSNTAAGWVAGLMFKSLYLLVVGPLWVIAKLVTLFIFLIMFSFWILLFLIFAILILW